jgi:polynucleotide 5'-kinase involved in rRNA processing
LKPCQLEIDGNLKITVHKGKVLVSGKIFQEQETFTIYSSINHITVSANSACLLIMEKFGFDFNVKILKELDQDFKVTPCRDLLGTKLSATAMTSVIIGPVNSGKSTTARHLANMYLNNHKTVAFLDCDLGQPEFTPPGMISLTLVTEPLLGPPCTHFKPSKYSIFIGDTSPKRDPDAYITGLFKLVDLYRNDCIGIPLVVNTSGWVRGIIGFDIRSRF